MTTAIHAKPHNSMAAGLSAAMSVIIWICVSILAIAYVAFLSALPSGLSGQDVQVLGLTIENRDIPPGVILSGLATLTIWMVGIIYICLQLRRILRTLAGGDPFVSDNTSRLTNIAAAIALMEIARLLVTACIRNFVDFGGAEPPAYSISLVSWAGAVAFFVLSQVFREGTRLREDAKMTI